MDFDEIKKQQEASADDESSGASGAIDRELLEKPYFPETAEAPKKRRSIPSVLRNAARVAAALAIVSVSAYFFLPSFFTSRLSAGTEGKDNSAVAERTTADSTLTEIPTTTTAAATSETTASTSAKTTSETTKTPTTTATTFNDRVTYVSGGRTSGPNGEVSTGGKTTVKGCNGIIWMSIDQIKSEIDRLTLNRFYDPVQSDTHSVPNYDLDFAEFYDIIAKIKPYAWKDCSGGINPYELKACTITVIGNNTVYTYLTFGRNENGKCFVWSQYDNKIAYPSESDFGYFEDIFLQASV